MGRKEKKRKREAKNVSKTIVVDLEEVERLARLEVLGMEDWSSYNWQEKAKKDIIVSLKSKKKAILSGRRRCPLRISLGRCKIDPPVVYERLLE